MRWPFLCLRWERGGTAGLITQLHKQAIAIPGHGYGAIQLAPNTATDQAQQQIHRPLKLLVITTGQ